MSMNRLVDDEKFGTYLLKFHKFKCVISAM